MPAQKEMTGAANAAALETVPVLYTLPLQYATIFDRLSSLLNAILIHRIAYGYCLMPFFDIINITNKHIGLVNCKILEK